MESMLLKYIEKKQKFQLIHLQRYLRDTKNSIKGDLDHGKKIFTNFKEDIKFIKNNFIKADFPLPITNSVIKNFINQQATVQQNKEDELIILSYFFEVEPPLLLLKSPYCKKIRAKSRLH